MRAKGGEQASERVGRMGIVNIDRGPVRQARGQFQPAAHAPQADQVIQRIALPERDGECSGSQGIVGLEPARQGQGDLAANSSRCLDTHRLAVRERPGREQTNCGPSLADGVQSKPPASGDILKRGKSGRVQVAGRHRGCALRQQVENSRSFAAR